MKLTLSEPTSGFNLAAVNDNFQKIEDEFQNKVLYRDNPVGEPNSLETDIDANSRSIYNVGTLAVLDEITVGGTDIFDVLSDLVDSAIVSETNAANSAADALASEQAAAASAAVADVSEANALAYSNNSAASYALTDAIADAFAGGTVGFDAIAYDWGSVGDPTTYFNRDFGTIV